MKLRESATLNAFGHIEPIPTFHPPSLKNPTRIPADNPKEKSNKFLDKMMRKSKRTKKHRKELARHQGPQQMPTRNYNWRINASANVHSIRNSVWCKV
jgi:sugar-specific transcriptional regulator TrmB